MKSKWFESVFLASLLPKMESNQKYPNSIILSDKQAEVCHNNMEHKSSANDGGITVFRTYYYEYAMDGYVFSLFKRGRYNILHVNRTQTEKQKKTAHAVLQEIEKLESELDVLYENGASEESISEYESMINGLWEQYNEAYKIA